MDTTITLAFGNEIRRVRIGDVAGELTFAQLRSSVEERFPSLINEEFRVMWKGKDGDLITVGTDAEFVEAIREMKAYVPMFFVKTISKESVAGPEASPAPVATPTVSVATPNLKYPVLGKIICAPCEISYVDLFLGAHVVPGNVFIEKIRTGEEYTALEGYFDRGRALKAHPAASALAEHLRGALVEAAANVQTKWFYFVAASSGCGKSQLPFYLSTPVVYLQLTDSQPMYRCFSSIMSQVLTALEHDQRQLGHSPHATEFLRDSTLQLCTVGLLVALFTATRGMSNQQSLECLSGWTGPARFAFQPMSTAEARARIQALRTSTEGSDAVDPLFVVDEAPSDEGHHAELFQSCILLRNLIRSMGCLCLMSGTETATMDALDPPRLGSRCEGERVYEYMRLVTELPSTYWPIFTASPRYATLLPRLSADVVSMLQSTRPLFAEYVLEAILKSSSSAEADDEPVGLTAAVLRAVKSRIVERKTRFATLHGLYAQLALFHRDFLDATAPGLLREADESSSDCSSSPSPDVKNQRVTRSTTVARARADDEKELDREECRSLLMRERMFCHRYHFGTLQLPAQVRRFDAVPITRVWFNWQWQTVMVQAADRPDTYYPFEPNVNFLPPHADRLLYLICLRDGVYFQAPRAYPRRISTSRALYQIFERRQARKLHLFMNKRAEKSSGKILEMETAAAAIAASHSYDALDGCPLSYFLRALVAELNASVKYQPQDSFELTGMPAPYDSLHVPLLSPANASWVDPAGEASAAEPAGSAVIGAGQGGDGAVGAGQGGQRAAAAGHGGTGVVVLGLDNSRTVVGDYSVAADLKCAGEYPILFGATVETAGTEVKGYDRLVPTSEVTEAITSSHARGHTLTILVARTTAKIKETIGFRKACEGSTVVKLRGNASADVKVATQLSWEHLGGRQVADAVPDSALPGHTVVLVDLESIYHGRYEKLRNFYMDT